MKLSCPLPSCFSQALSLGVPISKTKVVLVPTFCVCGGGPGVCLCRAVSMECGMQVVFPRSWEHLCNWHSVMGGLKTNN